MRAPSINDLRLAADVLERQDAPPNTALLRVAAMLRREADKREDVQLARTMRVPLSAVRSLRAQGRRS